MTRLELLAPAKDAETAIAAIDHGADAVYIGGPCFGARHAASNSPEQIARVADYAHKYGVRVYVTLNTLLYDDELAEASHTARAVIAAGADALIVQDMAYLRMGLEAELHASTQMCNMSPEKVEFLYRCGFSRVVLERALSLEQIKAVRAATDVELECFVHGAICVGYSGRCYLSRSMGPRSGNRGECSQPCRLTYDLVDANNKIIINNRHLLSVKDMNLSLQLESLIDAGVTSFKIEGRLKDIGYVKNIVSFYSRELDAIIARRKDCIRASSGRSVIDFEPDPSKSFSRGETEYLFLGKPSALASFETPKSMGEYIGRVEFVSERLFVLDRQSDLATGDGICFVGVVGMAGTSVNASDGRHIEPNKMDGIAEGVEIYRNSDRRFNLSLDRSRTRRVIRCGVRVEISRNAVVMTLEDADGFTSRTMREGDFEVALDAAKMAATVRAQMLKSGDTVFLAEDIVVNGSEWFVPASLLAAMRRDGYQMLLNKRIDAKPIRNIISEDMTIRYPSTELTAEDNITNPLAEQFYRDHGVTHIRRGLDAEDSTLGHRVMMSGYCIRREIGECLMGAHRLKGPLFLMRGVKRYELCFDCHRCEMSLIDHT